MQSLWVSATAEQMGSSSRKQNQTNLEILVCNIFDGKKSDMFFERLFGSIQNSVLNGRDLNTLLNG